MAVTIYFSETKDFKLIRELVLAETNDYLVYVYADTKNIKIPRDLIRDLPVFGNNIIWVDSAKMDTSQIVNHVVLTIGQFLNAEDPINFIIASRTSRYEKAISLLAEQGINVEQIGMSAETVTKKPGRKRGRPKGSKNVKNRAAQLSSETSPEPAAKKKRGRPRKIKADEPVQTTKKKRGRPPKDKSVTEIQIAPKKRGRPRKTRTEEVAAKKGRKPRTEKAVSEEMVAEKVKQFASKDQDVSKIQEIIFALRKVQRPKFDLKLAEFIQSVLAIDITTANTVIEKMKATGMMDNSGKGGRLIYKD